MSLAVDGYYFVCTFDILLRCWILIVTIDVMPVAVVLEERKS